MPESRVFEWAAAKLQELTRLDGPQARGFLRLTLKAAGLPPSSLTALQLRQVALHLMPERLVKHGVEETKTVTTVLGNCPADLGPEVEDALNVFRRLGRS